MDTEMKLLRFSDDVLLHILQNMEGYDLLNVIDTCMRLCKVSRDRTLWETADLTAGRLTAAEVRKRVIPCLQTCTNTLLLRGYKETRRKNTNWRTDLLTPKILEKIGQKCGCLSRLSVSEALVNANKLKMLDFGNLNSLRKLSIIDCEFFNLPSPTVDGSYFKNTHFLLPYLEHLEIINCHWITDYDLMVLSKVDTIKSLILRKCVRIGVTIAYLSMSFRFGFRNLETLDMRGTSLANSDIQSVVQAGTLKSLSVGPIGQVSRMSDDCSDGLSLVFPNPLRRRETPQEVLVINMGPNGPNWREASEADLQDLGIEIVRNGVGKSKEYEEADHYFIGKEGKLINPSLDKNEPSQGCSKRKRHECDAAGPASKQPRPNQSDSDTDDEIEHISPPILPRCKQSSLPDTELTDIVLHCTGRHMPILERLVVAGCAITSPALKEFVQRAHSLTYVDVSDTLVDYEGLKESSAFKPECHFVATHLPAL